MIVGPMQLFMPEAAAARLGPLVWVLLSCFYALWLTLIVLLSRPRLVIYNATGEQLLPILEDITRRIDPSTAWAADAVCLPQARVQLHVESFAPLCNVALVATGQEQSASGWRRLELALRLRLQETPIEAPAHGRWLALCGLLILMLLASWVADDPQAIADGFHRMMSL